MKLKNVDVLPGVITKVDDDFKVGRVKAIVPTLFTTEMEEEGLPWIYPFTMAGNQYFSKQMVDNKIWVIYNKDSFEEFWYVPMVQYTDDTKTAIGNYENSEILISRSLGDNSVFIYYNDDEGLMIKVGNNSSINVKLDSTINITSGKAQINLKDGKVYTGQGGDGEPSVMGDVLYNILNKLQIALMAASTAALPGYTNPLSEPLKQCSKAISDDMNKVRAQFTFNE